MNKNFLGKYFKREERKSRKLHHEVDPSSWPEYLTATQSRVRRVMTERRAAPHINKVASSVEGMYADETAQDVAHSQVSKSRRGNLPRQLSPIKVLAWGGWGIAMLTFASSLLLNFPFGVGALVLKAIPGESRAGEIILTTAETTELHPGDTTEILVSLNGLGGKAIQGATAALSYDQDVLELQEVRANASDFSKVLDNHYDTSEGKIFLSLQGPVAQNTGSVELATISFKVKAFVGKTDLHVVPETHITFQDQEPTLPENFGKLTLGVTRDKISPVTLLLPKKKDVVVINGSLDDWRDVIFYNPVSFQPSGTPLSDANLKEGRITSARDFGGVLQLAQTDQDFYLAFSVTDDEVLDGDRVGIKFGSRMFAVPITESISAVYTKDQIEARAARIEAGYILEVRMPLSVLASDGLETSFNFEVHDLDSQDSASMILSYPNDSMMQP